MLFGSFYIKHAILSVIITVMLLFDYAFINSGVLVNSDNILINNGYIKDKISQSEYYVKELNNVFDDKHKISSVLVRSVSNKEYIGIGIMLTCGINNEKGHYFVLENKLNDIDYCQICGKQVNYKLLDKFVFNDYTISDIEDYNIKSFIDEIVIGVLSLVFLLYILYIIYMSCYMFLANGIIIRDYSGILKYDSIFFKIYLIITAYYLLNFLYNLL